MMTASARSEPIAPPRRRRAVLTWVLLGILAVGLLTVVMAFPVVFRVARIEGQAMAPTLRDQDRLIVNKMAYLTKPPQRGDIVMMH